MNAHRVTGALDLAKAGYEKLFHDWLPAYCGYLADGAATAPHKLLLLSRFSRVRLCATP